jgi:hypothetical protein
MSLRALQTSAEEGLPKVVLCSAEQYSLWKQRVSTICWAQTRLDIFSLSDVECDAHLKAHDDSKGKGKEKEVDVIGRCWATITSLLSDELFLKVSHVKKGHVASLLFEIQASLQVATLDDVQPLRVDLYGADMVRDCKNDLQTFISFLLSKRDKLAFLKSPVPDAELIHIFLKGLSPVFAPIQVHLAIPGTLPKDFESVVAIVRRFSSNPTVAAELAKSKGASASVLLSNSMTNGSMAQRDPGKVIYCRLFASTGTCRFGEKCKFSHGMSAANNAQQPSGNRQRDFSGVTCFYCKKKGHTQTVCKKKQMIWQASKRLSLF